MTNTNMTPSNVYLISLQSKKSRVTMSSLLNRVSYRLQGVADHEKCDWAKLDYQKVMLLMNDMKDEGMSPNTINTYLAAIKGVAKESWRGRILDIEAYQFIKEVTRLKGQRKQRGRALTQEEVRLLIETCDGSIISLRDSALMALTYSAGMRRSEVADLTLDNIDLNKHSVTIRGKGNKECVNYLNKKTITLLKKWLSQRGNTQGSLFTRVRKGGKVTLEGITDKSVSNIIEARAESVCDIKLMAHDLRKSFATNLLAAGEDLFVVSDLMRHSSIETTRVYDLRSKDTRKEAAVRLTF